MEITTIYLDDPSNNAFNRTEALSSTTFEDLVNVDIKKPGRYIGHELGAQ